jgi:hypothetical protein
VAVERMGRRGRVPLWRRLSSEAQLWLAVGFASLTATALGTATLLIAFATMLSESCGEDQRWAALCVATGLAGLAAVAGLVPAVRSLWASASALHPRWVPGVVAVTVVAWMVAAVSALLPTGGCG